MPQVWVGRADEQKQSERSEEHGFGGFRYGAHAGELYYRIYGKYFDRDGGFDADSLPDDRWHAGRTGFRSDWRASGVDSFTFQGDLYDGSAEQSIPSVTVTNPDGSSPSLPPDHTVDFDGGNLIARLTCTTTCLAAGSSTFTGLANTSAR